MEVEAEIVTTIKKEPTPVPVASPQVSQTTTEIPVSKLLEKTEPIVAAATSENKAPKKSLFSAGIAGLKQKLADQITDGPVTASGVINRDTFERDWFLMIDRISKDNQTIASTLSRKLPLIEGDNLLVVDVVNSVEPDLITAKQELICETFRNITSVYPGFRFNLVEVKVDDTPKLFKPKDKLNHMLAKNPDLKALIAGLELEIEH